MLEYNRGYRLAVDGGVAARTVCITERRLTGCCRPLRDSGQRWRHPGVAVEQTLSFIALEF